MVVVVNTHRELHTPVDDLDDREKLKFKRRISTMLNTGGGRKEIITLDGLPDFHPDRTVYQKPLVIALARAHQWQRILDEGSVSSISELAKRLKGDRAYVSRLLHVTLPACSISTSHRHFL